MLEPKVFLIAHTTQVYTMVYLRWPMLFQDGFRTSVESIIFDSEKV